MKTLNWWANIASTSNFFCKIYQKKLLDYKTIKKYLNMQFKNDVIIHKTIKFKNQCCTNKIKKSSHKSILLTSHKKVIARSDKLSSDVQSSGSVIIVPPLQSPPGAAKVHLTKQMKRWNLEQPLKTLQLQLACVFSHSSML